MAAKLREELEREVLVVLELCCVPPLLHEWKWSATTCSCGGGGWSRDRLDLVRQTRTRSGGQANGGWLRLRVLDLLPATLPMTAVDPHVRVEVGEREEGGTGKSRGWQLPQHYGYM